jgi:hypothetical protein
MARTGDRFRLLAAWWFAVVVLAMVGVLCGCATTRAGEGRVLWQVRDQYVKIEKQDRPAGATVSANSHPADISDERVRSMLESMMVRPERGEQEVPLFNEDELAILGENIHNGLAQANPDEDVTFAIIGHYPSLMGLVRERMVTTGRVFCRDGELNIIFGDMHRSFRENEDRRLQPFLPGSRGAAPAREWRLIAKAGGEPFVAKRPDWVSFSLAAPPAVVTAPAAVVPATGAGRGTEQKAPTAVSPAKPATAGKKSPEERLIILNDLHNKKLITDEEYRAKRLEILNEL